MPYRLNRKNLAVTRVLPKGPNGDKRLNYVHVNRQGSTATDGQMIARVSLPTVEGQPHTPYIYPKAVVAKVMPVDEKETILMAGELAAATTAENSVPTWDMMIPRPADQKASFTCDAGELLTLLKVALDVTEDADRCIRIRICESSALGQTLRIDSLAFGGKQAFLGVLKGLEYEGTDIAGEHSLHFSSDEKVKKSPLPLVLSTGRKFRG